MPRHNKLYVYPEGGEEVAVEFATLSRPISMQLVAVTTRAVPSADAYILSFGSAAILHPLADLRHRPLAEAIATIMQEGASYISYEAALSAWKGGVVEAALAGLKSRDHERPLLAPESKLPDGQTETAAILVDASSTVVAV